MMRSMMKSALEWMLNTEMDVHLGCRTLTALAPLAETDAADEPAGTDASTARSRLRKGNRRIGHSEKTVQGDQSDFVTVHGLKLPMRHFRGFGTVGPWTGRIDAFERKIARSWS
ncbi:MAG: hypothetical protein IT427_16930 [Pirellulales bacterium]|nr:hypothetical protein [Pirellulales bacterium]